MAGFEDLIRSTLKKQGDHSAERRAAIYDSSRHALERMLEQNDKLDDVAAKVQRERLEAAIAKIEGDYSASEELHASEPPPPMVDPSPPVSEKPPSGKDLHASEPPPPKIDASPPVSVEVPSVAAPSRATPVAPPPLTTEPEVKASVPPPQPRLKPDPVPDIVQRGPASLSATRETEGRVSADLPEVASAGEEPPTSPPDYQGKALREKRPFAKLLLWAIILAGLGTAIWWAISFGPALIKAQLDGSVENPKQRIETGSFVPQGEDGWVSIFEPASNPEGIETGQTGRAELLTIEGKQVARLASAAQENSTIKIRVPRGVMETLRGKAATFEVTLASEAGQAQQFALYCEFGEMGSCGRKRFRAKAMPEAHIFDVLINDATLEEGQDAFIAINTDISATGKVLDLYSIRVRTGA